jgi:hypothetical protein
VNTRHTDHWDYSRESPKEKRERLFEEVQRAEGPDPERFEPGRFAIRWRTTKKQKLQLMEELLNS